MVFPVIDRLNGRNVVLASASPRRSEILKNLGVKFRIVPSTFAEDLDKNNFQHPSDYVMATAEAKGLEVFERIASTSGDGAVPVVISADTIVCHAGRILEKPSSAEHAKDVLRSLSGHVHEVLTAVVVFHGVDSNGALLRTSAVECTKVEFGPLTTEDIDAYVATGEPMDKAGAYGYQGLAAALIRRIDGDYYNVVGFPTYTFMKLLTNLVNTSSV
ncbi:hypothetical protein HDU85_001962 [Gaertneriomyces sp. JEL0708]|nr:hypothetical protein HDU85_001962 [Gaertneriomyces sp. JEL0708]